MTVMYLFKKMQQNIENYFNYLLGRTTEKWIPGDRAPVVKRPDKFWQF